MRLPEVNSGSWVFVNLFIKGDCVMQVVLTIVGKDKVGITARVTNALAEMNINIININQNIMQGFFNMVLIADMEGANVTLARAREVMVQLGEEIGVEIRLQSEEIFTAMHRI